jgi:DNA-binding CsgD family transcriptional regulator
VDKTIELLKQAEARIKTMMDDFRQVAIKSQEIVALLSKYTLEPTIAPDLSELTVTEKEILTLMGKKLKGREIAEMKKISIRTFNTHRDRIKNKFSMESSYDLKRFAEGLIAEGKL